MQKLSLRSETSKPTFRVSPPAASETSNRIMCSDPGSPDSNDISSSISRRLRRSLKPLTKLHVIGTLWVGETSQWTRSIELSLLLVLVIFVMLSQPKSEKSKVNLTLCLMMLPSTAPLSAYPGHNFRAHDSTQTVPRLGTGKVCLP